MHAMVGTIILSALFSSLYAPADTAPAAGKYELVYLGLTGELTYCVVKLTPNGTGISADLVFANPRTMTGLKGVDLADGILRLTIDRPDGAKVFEGRVPRPGAETILGCLGRFDWGFAPARLTLTNADKPGNEGLVRPASPELLVRAQTLASKNDALAADLYCQVLQAHPQTLAAIAAADWLTKEIGRTSADATDFGRWAAHIAKHAAAYGPLYESELRAQIARSVISRSGYQTLAVEYARQAEQLFSKSASASEQIRSLEPLAGIYQTAKMSADLSRINARLEALRLRAVAPSAPTPFAGRKGTSSRVVVLELFTGAECLPCVGADAAFDALQKTYNPTELVLLQYHLHIPRPDPLTSPASEARWGYYREKFPKDIRGTPSSLLDGKPTPVRGGRLTESMEFYNEYRALIDRGVEQPAAATLTGSASRQGEKIIIRSGVTRLQNPDEHKRLRLLLAEESIRYTGANKQAIHHMVVRTMPGGMEGFKLTGAESKQESVVELDKLRTELVQRLDEYAATKAPFRDVARPMDMTNLKVIALVQNDETGAILNAAQWDVERTK
jgi:hypothetical protein